MNIRMLELIKGAQQATGLVVIIDVFRAFTTACYVMSKGAKMIIPVGRAEEALRLKHGNPEYVLIGERKGRIMQGSDYGNSPWLIQNIDFTGKTIIQTTSAGTQGLVHAVQAQEIITGSFVNAGAIARYIESRKPQMVSLVSMGLEGIKPSKEDELCAQYIRSLLLKLPFDLEHIPQILRHGSGSRFFDPANQAWSPSEDFGLCLKYDIFNFVLKAKTEGGLLCLKKVDI